MDDERGLMAEQEALAVVGRQLYRLIPEGARVVVFRAAVLSAVMSASAVAEAEDGSTSSLRLGGKLDSDDVDALRSLMYRPGSGTWFSLELTVTAQQSMTSRFNYEDEPDFGLGGVDPIAYVTDQDAFPRDEAHQPGWLKLKLAEGRARLAARDK